ncbi:hypothetical protein AAY473_004175, partial [Plecturocebus cupreus]
MLNREIRICERTAVSKTLNLDERSEHQVLLGTCCTGKGLSTEVLDKPEEPREAGHSGSCLSSWSFRRLSWEDHLRPGAGEQPGDSGKLLKSINTAIILIISAFPEAESGGSPEVRNLKSARPTWLNPAFQAKKQEKTRQTQWLTPVIPALREAKTGGSLATREAEAGESLEPRKWRLWSAEIMPLHSSLCNR